VTSAAQEVLAAALALPANEREALVGALSSSLEPSTLSPEWQAEIARRLERIEGGSATFLDAQEHLQSLRASYGDR
jgi:putative addiction module component (TIGR02574 family)